CDTFFFRDLRILDIMKGYLQKHFPNGTHIANFGCSNGEETRSIDMLLQEINADKRYTITGYDPVSIRIQEARRGQYGIGLNLDRFLTQTEDTLRDRGKVLKRLFDQFFRPAYFKNHDYEDVFEAKKTPLSCIKGFKKGNIHDVETLLKGKNTGVVVFKNAWYHLMQNSPGAFNFPKEYDDLSTLKTVLRKIHRALPENGILVTGSLPRDHIMGDYALESGIITDSPFHLALKECGFEPVEESLVNIPPERGPMDFMFYEDVKVYSIWKKKSQHVEKP
ncbi:MAG: hypothetical protein K2X66_10280, partial [Cyanobacteria bacterium]|nr:hypothetical protein [Cyanobacteriota bacterium]